MKWTRTWVVAFATLAAAAPAEAAGFGDIFTGRTMRIDVFHSGTATEEHLAVDRVRVEGEWPGSRTALLDDTNLGKYLLAVVDLATQQTVYSQGFASIYGEWETTEAEKMRNIRSASRNHLPPDYQLPITGMRIVLGPALPKEAGQ